ncbi:MAG: MFS transporter [Candidatus Paceibacterota bacterium]|jgi:DHA3 family multidrug efflux protein-like MFS transporter|nr:MFS transporter [Candidatus Paceibacterota bacterium]
MKIFYHILSNSLFVTVTNFFVWFAFIFWMYLETRSVLATSISGGVFMLAMSFSSFWFGSIVDHHKKKRVMATSTSITFAFFIAAFLFYASTPAENFREMTSPSLWILAALVLSGMLASNLRGIALSTIVTITVPKEERDRANGMVGMVMGFSSMGAGLSSGFALAYAGLYYVLLIGVVLTALALIHLYFLEIPEANIVSTGAGAGKIDLRGTIDLMRTMPGLFALIFFTTFNNFLGGVFMSLMDPYGLTLVNVQTWSVLWGVLSAGFILGGLYIAKKGLGPDPLRTLFMINIVIWITTILFPIRHSIIILAIGIFIWVCLAPFIEAAEHTVIQKIVPLERQGRVFGFSQSVEVAASPLAAFLIGPIAEFIFIPFMTTGAGVSLIGGWFGTGPGRGMALVFIMAGFAGLAVTLISMRSPAYQLLAKLYREA